MPHSFHQVHAHLAKKKKSSITKFQKVLDKLIYVVAVIGPLMTLPQVLKIWLGKDATGVSVISWGAFLLLNVFWLSYGIIHKEKPVILSACAFAVVELFIVIGTILYG